MVLLQDCEELVLHNILSKVGARHATQLSCLSKSLRNAALDDSIWASFCLADFGISVPLDHHGNPSPSFKASLSLSCVCVCVCARDASLSLLYVAGGLISHLHLFVGKHIILVIYLFFSLVKWFHWEVFLLFWVDCSLSFFSLKRFLIIVNLQT
ncbi:F-box protein [Nymphaea thermarum]|nr:F-box protein [Nymphaea thermarum]